MNWDDAQQLIRKLADAVAGVLVTYAAITADMVMLWSGAIAGVLSVGWWYIWNRTRPPAA